MRIKIRGDTRKFYYKIYFPWISRKFICNILNFNLKKWHCPPFYDFQSTITPLLKKYEWILENSITKCRINKYFSKILANSETSYVLKLLAVLCPINISIYKIARNFFTDKNPLFFALHFKPHSLIYCSLIM